jgi:hypothetical protein
MRTNWIVSTAVVVMSVTAAVGAQSTKGMGKPSKTDAMRTTYIGCVESVNHGGAFLLTKVGGISAQSTHGDMAMEHHGMATKSDAAEALPHDQPPMADDKMDTMPSTSFALAGSANLSKHVGQKVAVTGSLADGWTGTTRQDVSTLTIKTLKVIGKSCS